MGMIYDQPDFGKLGVDIVDGTMALSIPIRPSTPMLRLDGRFQRVL